MDGVHIQLSKEQHDAVKAPIDRPLLILAAAGSGKTLVLCSRILHLISQGVPPKDILAVTFTRRAGQDLVRRLHAVASAVQTSNSICIEGVRVCTFHSFCLSVIRAFPSHSGLDPGFIIFTPKMQVDLLEMLVENWYEERRNDQQLGGPFDSNNRHYQEKSLHSAKKRGMFQAEAYHLYRQLQHMQRFGKPENQVEDKKLCNESRHDLFNWAYMKYYMHLKDTNAIDFSDFPRRTIEVLKGCPEALTSTGLQAQYILVDEFQDTDVDQFELLKLLCGDRKHLTVVGDDDQQIYSWRGAAGIYNLSMFEGAFPGAIILKLEQNFRSTGAIVAAARCVIGKNINRMPKTIRTLSPTGTILTVCECRNEQCEAAAVCDYIISIKQHGVPSHEIAVLYRLQRVGLELQNSLNARGVQCEIKGGGSGAGDSHFGGPGADARKGLEAAGGVLHDILAVLRLIIRESDDLACRQLMEVVCPVPGPAISACLRHLQLEHNIPLLHALKSTRLHLLGLVSCESLSSYFPAKSLLAPSKADQQFLEGVYILLSIVEATKEDVKNLGFRDIIINLLQQIAPFRDNDVKKRVFMKTGMNWKKGMASCFSQLDAGDATKLEYSGVKAFLREAALFDMKKEDRGDDAVDKGINRVSYKELVRQKRQGNPILSCHGLSSSRSSKNQVVGIERLKYFLDHVMLRMHDGELGDCNEYCSLDSETQSKSRNVTSDAVTLSTIHQAKGLEWTVVILVRTNEGVMPLIDCEVSEQGNTHKTHIIDRGFVEEKKNSKLSIETQNCKGAFQRKAVALLGRCHAKTTNDTINCPIFRKISELEAIEEERRLMYVALTRAKQHVMITHVMFCSGQQLLSSRFLADIPPGLMRRTACYDSNSTQGKLCTSPLSLTQSFVTFTSTASKVQAFSPDFAKPRGEVLARSECSLQMDSLKNSPSVIKKKRKVLKSWENSLGGVNQQESMGQIDCEHELKMSQELSAKLSGSNLTMDGLANYPNHLGNENSNLSGRGRGALIETSSEDSDFESPIRTGKRRNNISIVSSPSN